jgi:signal transduction histidine kinase
MNHLPRAALAVSAGSRARPAAGLAWRGLTEILAGPDPAPGPRWREPRHRRAAQGALAAAMVVLGLISLASIRHLPPGDRVLSGALPLSAGRLTATWPLTAAQALTAVAVVLPLPLAARYPLLGWRAGWLALLLAPLVPGYWWGGWPWGPAQLLTMVAVFCMAGVRHQRRVLWWMWALTLIPSWLWIRADIANPNGPVGATVAFTALTIAVDSAIFQRRAQRALIAQVERTELERARRAVLEERTRIARELHDVVAHHMSLIAVRAETAPYRLSGLPEPTLAEFGSLSAAAREGLAEMRRLLGVLRSDEPAGHAPQPQLSDLPGLVDAARQAGAAIELSVPATLDRVPSGVGVCAFRIVQESLANAGQHAPGAAVTVSVGHGAGAVALRVANGPGGPAGPPRIGSRGGHGLTGMRERVALLGGSLTAGPAPDGGYVVSAVLPLSPTP